jgi:hypothetical protein
MKRPFKLVSILSRKQIIADFIIQLGKSKKSSEPWISCNNTPSYNYGKRNEFIAENKG